MKEISFTRISIDSYLEPVLPEDGQIISKLVQDLCDAEKPNRVLFVRTPTTGGFLESLKLPESVVPVWARYESHQRHEGEYLAREPYVSLMKTMAQRGDRFDMIVMDPSHEIATSLGDFELCLSLLATEGILLSHDCAPSRPRLATAVFHEGLWCGQTYAALAAFAVKHPEVAVGVLDTDTGIAMIRRHDAAPEGLRLQPSAHKHSKQIRLQSELQSLIEHGQDREAYLYFRRHGLALVGLRSSRRFRARRVFALARRKVSRVLVLSCNRLFPAS
jgi:hypothetical protein